MLDLGNLADQGFRIHIGEQGECIGAADFDGDGFDDVAVRGGAYVFVVFGNGPARLFARGDANMDKRIDISDAVTTLSYLFLGMGELECLDAADANDDGELNITDPIYLLEHLFLGGAPPPPPYPEAGLDPTPDDLGC